MQLRCTHAFGNFKPGEEVEVEDGAVFDTAHFEPVEPEPEYTFAAVADPEEEGK